MFTLHSARLRRRLTAPSSGSLRRRVRERRQAEKTRAEGERLARELREQRAIDKFESQRRAREELATYEPWGRAGGGAPNPQGVRFSNIRATGIFPEDELRGVSIYEASKKWTTTQQRRKRQTPIKLREDPQLCYAENLRKSVDNDIRYKQSPNQQMLYKQDLDEFIKQRRKTTKEEIKRDLEYEQKLLNMDGPWGKPGPGGTIWRLPRNIGLNFWKSMGWTDNEIFSKLKRDQRGVNLSSLTLPKVKRDDDTHGDTRDKENIKPTLVDKLPHISYNDSPTGSGRDRRREMDEKVKAIYGTNRKYKRSPKKKKIIKRLSNGDKVSRVCLDDYDTHYNEGDVVTQKKPTPEANILRVTGGIELVPLLARRRRVDARTLPSSDVTRPPEQPCQWRELQVDYLRALKRQMRVKCEQKEESRRNSAESVKQHHVTWASLWGRPGHGAPQQRGRYARSNLAQLLYVQPFSNSQ